MSYLAVIVVLFVLCRGLHLRSLTARHELLHTRQRGVFRLELRRKAELVSHSDGCGGRCFPTPRETRTLALVLGVFQVWAKAESVALPTVFQDAVDTVEASDCDSYFPASFCSIQPLATVSLFHTLA